MFDCLDLICRNVGTPGLAQIDGLIRKLPGLEITRKTNKY